MPSIEALLNILLEAIRSYGLIGFFTAMIVQAVVAPIPAELLLAVGGALYGVQTASIVGFTACVAGSAICFAIARLGGRPLVAKLVGSRWLDETDKWFGKYGVWAVLAARLIPIIPLDVVSYGAGLTAMGFKGFIAATAVGLAPRIMLYTTFGKLTIDWLGELGLPGGTAEALLALVIAATAAAVILQTRGVKKGRGACGG